MNNFLQNNRIVSCSPTRQKATLVRPNNRIKDWSETVNQDFGDELINDITQADGSKVFEGVGRVALRNEGNDCV